MSETCTSNSAERSIKLYCPSASKQQLIVVAEEDEQQRVDLGFISRAFGLDPATIKLNRHFLSRGLDFISSSLTWKSLLSFFASRGFPTGSNDAPLIVDGKLCKSGTKRGHDPSCSENWDNQSFNHNNSIIKRYIGLENINILKKTKKDDNNNAGICTSWSGIDCFGSPLKRKATMEEDDISMKKKMSRRDAGILPNNCISKNKRIREDETDTILTNHHKKVVSHGC